MNYASDDMKVFAIDYFIPSNGKREIKSHFTYASSRKNAENNTRMMESPDRVNIIKITPIVFDDYADKVLNDALVNHLSKNDERDMDVSKNEIC